MNDFFRELRAYLPILISGAAFAVSVVSLWLTRKNWHQSNRPIVIAFVTEREPSNQTGTFDLVVANTGNRPAVNVQLYAEQSDIAQLLEEDSEPKRLEHIAQSFSPESKIPVLRNGEELTTAFGAFSNEAHNGKWLNYGMEIGIGITYTDLEGHPYKSEMPLKIYARKGFGGSVWV